MKRTIILGINFKYRNLNDTLPEVLKQVEEATGKRPAFAICDRRYRGEKKISITEILIPCRPKKTDTVYQRRKARQSFRRRAGIEPVIRLVKHDYRMAKNYLKGSIEDAINLFMAAAAFNFRKLIKAWAHYFVLFIIFPLGLDWKPRRAAWSYRDKRFFQARLY
jgi:transposase, IS5 family